MPKWLSYIVLIPGLVMAIKIAFRWEDGTTETIGLSGMLIVIGIALRGMSQAESLRSSDNKEEARAAEINFAFSRMMGTGLIALAMFGFSLYVNINEEFLTEKWVFWFSLPFLFFLLTIRYYRVWKKICFLYGSGKVIKGVVTQIEDQLHHKQQTSYQLVSFTFEVPEKGTYSGSSTCPYSPLVQYEPEQTVEVLYDPSNPERNLLLNAWHGKGLHSKREYDKKLARPDEGEHK